MAMPTTPVYLAAAGRRRSPAGLRRASAAARDGDEASLGCRALGGEPGPCLRLEQRLSGALLRLHPPDLVLHGGEQLPALRQLLVGALLRRLVGDDLGLPLDAPARALRDGPAPHAGTASRRRTP